jgi:hypothetical protein
MAQFRLRRRDSDAPEWVALDQVYHGELDQQGGGGRIWLHHPSGPHAGKYLAVMEDLEFVG